LTKDKPSLNSPNPMEDFYTPFTKPSKEKWLAQVEKELKRPLVPHEISPGLEANAFLCFEDKSPFPPSNYQTELGWVICQSLHEKSPAALNQEALASLNGGASGLSLSIDTLWSLEDYEKAFAGVFLDFITLKLSLEASQAQENLAVFCQYLNHQGYPYSSLRIWVNHPVPETLTPHPFEFEIKDKQDKDVITKLASLIKNAEKAKWQANQKVVFGLQAEKNFYLNIAQVKALRTIWQKVQEAYQEPNPEPAYIVLHIGRHGSEPNLAAIASTQQVVSGSIAGVNALEIETLPYDKTNYSTEFSQRITRNIQNIAAHESFLNQTSDPSKGSYLIDDLTKNLIKKIWTVFINDN
jgi:Methylmalonyl-CoA mutase